MLGVYHKESGEPIGQVSANWADLLTPIFERNGLTARSFDYEEVGTEDEPVQETAAVGVGCFVYRLFLACRLCGRRGLAGLHWLGAIAGGYRRAGLR